MTLMGQSLQPIKTILQIGQKWFSPSLIPQSETVLRKQNCVAHKFVQNLIIGLTHQHIRSLAKQNNQKWVALHQSEENN